MLKRAREPFILDDVDFICKTINAVPVPHVDQFTADKLGEAKLVEEVSAGSDKKIVKVTGCPEQSKTVSILVRGSNQLVLDEEDEDEAGDVTFGAALLGGEVEGDVP